LSRCSTPLHSQSTSAMSSIQSGGNLHSSNMAPRVLDYNSTYVERIPTTARTRKDPKPPVISPRVFEPRTGAHGISSNSHGGGSNHSTGFRVQASEHGSAGTMTDRRSAGNSSIVEVKKACAAAEQHQIRKPDDKGESLQDWEWDADEGCFHLRQMHTHRSDLFPSRICV
jgi:hypothetical protein